MIWRHPWRGKWDGEDAGLVPLRKLGTGYITICPDEAYEWRVVVRGIDDFPRAKRIRTWCMGLSVQSFRLPFAGQAPGALSELAGRGTAAFSVVS